MRSIAVLAILISTTSAGPSRRDRLCVAGSDEPHRDACVRSCDAGAALSCARLGLWYADHHDLDKAATAFDAACKRDYGIACHYLNLTDRLRNAKRPRGRVLVDYNQNAWGRTLASVYSVRPTPRACVSTPVTWPEIEAGLRIEDFRIDNVPERIREKGDLWKPVDAPGERFRLEALL